MYLKHEYFLPLGVAALQRVYKRRTVKPYEIIGENLTGANRNTRDGYTQNEMR